MNYSVHGILVSLGLRCSGLSIALLIGAVAWIATARLRATGVRASIGITVLVALLVIGARHGQAQQAAVCSETPGTGERVACMEAATSSNDIDRTLKGIDIDTTDDEFHGVHGRHEGSGNIEIDFQTGEEALIRNDIDTIGGDAHGVYGRHVGSGNIEIRGQNLHITTKGTFSHGVAGYLGYTYSTPPVPDLPPEAAGNINIVVSDSTIESTGDYSRGISAENHGGAGRIDIDVRNSTITTLSEANPGAGGKGIYAWRRGTATGDVEVTVHDTNITTKGANGFGIDVDHQGEDSANITIDVERGRIDTAGLNGYGVRGYRRSGTGNLDIDIVDTVINTTGENGRGIFANMYSNNGDIDVYAGNIDFTSTGEQGYGIYTRFQNGIGDILVNVRGGSITTKGAATYGLYNLHEGAGNIDIDVRNLVLKTESTGDPPGSATLSFGILGWHRGDGDIDIDVLGGSITTAGTYSYGIYGNHGSVGDITIGTRDGHTITTTGNNAHGIVAYHFGTEDSRAIDITVGGTVDASGAGSHGIRVGIVNGDGEAERVAAVGEDGYRQQTVTVNNRVYGGTGEAAGVFLAGGGKVFIGKQGTVGAVSGIAIHATGGTTPKLYVDIDLDLRRVAEVIGDDWIINDGGETTIVVNQVTLHDGANGVTGRTAPNGAWNVTMRGEGVTAVDRTDPDSVNWMITEPTTGIVADRDFSAGDFNETAWLRPPPPPVPEPTTPPVPEPTTPPVPEPTTPPVPEPTTPPDTGDMDGDRPTFIEEYAPRAAVYEALPGFLLRLNGGGPGGERITSPRSPVWMQLSVSRGSHSPEHSTVGQEYDFVRLAVEAGLDVAMGEHFIGSISLRHVTGSAEVSSPFGGGDIEAEGIGVSLGASWKGLGGYYANGSLSLTEYDVDVSSDDREIRTLKRDAGARGTLLNFEAGRRIALSERTNLTARAWMVRSAISVDKFTDKVAARVSVADTARFTGGLGMIAETERDLDNGTLSLRGSLDLAQTLDDAETVVDVSGTKLESKSAKNKLLLGLGGVYRMDRFSISGEVSMGGLGSDDTEYAGQVTLGLRF